MFKEILNEAKPTKDDAVMLCKRLYEKLSSVGFYPALTGGILYKDGCRKDIDIVIFRNRQTVVKFEMEFIEDLLVECGLSNFQYFGFVTKCKLGNISVDLFNPETEIEFCDGYYTG